MISRYTVCACTNMYMWQFQVENRHSCTLTHSLPPPPHTVMLSQVVNSTLYPAQSSLLSTLTNTAGGGQSSASPYATPTPTQPSLNSSQFSNGSSGYNNGGSYMGGYSASQAPPTDMPQQPHLLQQQHQTQQQTRTTSQGFPLSPTAYLNTQGDKEAKQVGGASLPGIQGTTNYPMKNESSLEGAGFPGEQDMFGSYPQPQMVPPQGYGAINRTNMTSPDANYSIAMKDETSMGTMGQFLNQFLSDPLNPTQVPSQTLSDSFQPSGGNQAQQQGLPSSSMFQFPTSPLRQGSQFELSPVSALPSLLQQQPASGDSASQSSMLRVSSAGNLGTLSEESSTPARPPLSRGKSEPIRHLQQQVKHLAQENERQMMEIEKQQSMAEQEYMAVLRQIAEQQASGKASRQQQEMLKSVLSDPSLINILRDVLIANPPPSSLVAREDARQRTRVQPLSITPTKMSSDSGTHVSNTPSPLISPSQVCICNDVMVM